MPDILTRADSLREFLTGAASDGAAQTDPSLSLGNYRSSTEAVSVGIEITNPISDVTVDYAGGANSEGDGTLTAVDTTHLTWKAPTALVAGSPAEFSGTGVAGIVEGNTPSEYLRVTCTTPFTPAASTITLAYLYNNAFGFDNVSSADAVAGITEYRSTIVRNESAGPVLLFKRWIAILGTVAVSDGGYLSGSGSGTIVTTGSFIDWPSTGWCHVQTSGGTTKEVVYYTSRTNTALTVPSAGRGLLGTSATAGSGTDNVYPVPGVALAIDSDGVEVFGSNIQTIASPTTAPTGVTWNIGITAATGLSIGTLLASRQVGIWMKRHCPAGLIATPRSLVKTHNSFSAF